jgi:hypothetical protein
MQAALMYAIESENSHGRRWISGVFPDRESAQLELGRLASEPGASHILVKTSADQFPLFIVEASGFSYVGLEELLHRLNATSPKNEEEYVHFNVYAVSAPYKPAVPGRNELGGILHWHITDSALREPRAGVLRAEFSELASDA